MCPYAHCEYPGPYERSQTFVTHGQNSAPGHENFVTWCGGILLRSPCSLLPSRSCSPYRSVITFGTRHAMPPNDLCLFNELFDDSVKPKYVQFR